MTVLMIKAMEQLNCATTSILRKGELDLPLVNTALQHFHRLEGRKIEGRPAACDEGCKEYTTQQQGPETSIGKWQCQPSFCKRIKSR